MPEKKRKKIFTFKNKRHLPGFLVWFLAFFLRCLSYSYRFRIIDSGASLAKLVDSPAVLAYWHNRLLLAAPLAPKFLRQRLSVLISASRDGEYVSAFIRHFGIRVVRGSSSRGGARALLVLLEELRIGRSVLLTVDGPRGPRYRVHPGVATLAGKGAVPLLPVCLNAAHYWELRSWDRLQIPIPFTRIDLFVGAPLQISTAEPPEQASERIRSAMLAITRDRQHKCKNECQPADS